MIYQTHSLIYSIVINRLLLLGLALFHNQWLKIRISKKNTQYTLCMSSRLEIE
ncbi:hypothetical protein HNQ54_001136 [Anaerocolumna cellulosilytica]|nr:hypothetical protein [Anaerocolumna cellulosilytica]